MVSGQTKHDGDSRPPPNLPSLPGTPITRRTRFVLISDTHNCTPHLPRGDVLIHAGDLTNQGSYSELSRVVKWLEKADFEAKIVIAGNHDMGLDEDFCARRGPSMNNQSTQSPAACLSLLKDSPTLTYLTHSSTTIRLASPRGPRTTFSVFGSPFSPSNASHGRFAAFTYDGPLHDLSPTTSSDLPRLWDSIPLDTDVIVTHTPPRMHRDESRDRRASGCEALRRALWRIRPRLAVCGHVHEARGAERVTWDLGCGNVAYKEVGVRPWEDPGRAGNKLSVVNLGAKGGDPLQNDGGCQRHQAEHQAAAEEKQQIASASRTPETMSTKAVTGDFSVAEPSIGTRGLGGQPTSARSDTAALLGRMGRRETCVVNCAIMGKSYPHVGGRTMNKPIVVDLDLPVWDE